MSDTQTVEEEKQQKKQRKKRGRKPNKHYLPWEEAREFVRNEKIPSRNKYHEWWDLNRPKVVPRWPDRVYEKYWTSWNDFLGNDNEFGHRLGKGWRPFEEAVKWAHTLGIKSYEQWMEYVRTNELPSDIPARPDLVYEKWRSWGYWLGNKTVESVVAKQEIQKVAVYYIIHEKNAPLNVFTYGVEFGGVSALKERWTVEQFDVVRLFWFNQDKADDIKKLVEYFSTPYLGSEKQRITPNVWQIISTLEMWLETIRKP